MSCTTVRNETSTCASPAAASPAPHFRLGNFKRTDELTDQETSEQIAGGPIGKLAGKAKEATGALVGNDDLAREGRLQQAQADAQAEATVKAGESRQREAEASLEAEKTETEVVVDRADASVRASLASILGDLPLGEDARQRATATEKRGRAMRLREQADRKTEEADTRLEHAAATERKRLAASRNATAA